MADGLRTIHILTTDETLLAQGRAATGALEGWEVCGVETVDRLLARPPVAGDVILIDKWLRGENVYEVCRRLTGRARCRTFVLAEHGNQAGAAIAHFCGASGMMKRPITASQLREALTDHAGPRPPLPQDARESKSTGPELPEEMLKDIATERPNANLVSALTDPETSLFNFAFLNYKLDEEFKRAQRFGEPLSCVMLGFEGQADSGVLSQLAGIILGASRDTDVLGRFDESSFLFLLPRTGPDGARVMAERVRAVAEEVGLRDLIGDPLQISVGISCAPHPEIRRREDLYAQAREHFFAARQAGGGVVTCG
jgi:diguanylate cyclase (GGDEF)-like protein